MRRILVCTPAYGGLLTTEYMMSFLRCTDEAAALGIQLGIYLLKNESFIQRGRNRCAYAALQGGWDALFFIDADIRWTWAEMKLLLDSESPIIAGAYPAKTLPITLNFDPLPEHARQYFYNGRRDLSSFQKFTEEAGSTGEVEIQHATTGFMLIDCSVLRKLKNSRPSYRYPCLISGETEVHHDYFKSGVYDEDFLTEDYGFCRAARKEGFRIMLQTQAHVDHVGSFIFSPKDPA